MFNLTAWRLAGYYGSLFAVVGVQLPYWPVYLQHRGFDAAEIGLILSAGLWLKTLVNPLIAQGADAFAMRRPIMLLLAATSASAFLLLGGTAAVPVMVGLAILAPLAFSAILPLGESAALGVIYDRGLDYGRLRLWGSLTFVAASMLGGPLLSAYGGDAVLYGIVTLVVATFVACALMPMPDTAAGTARGAPILRLLGNRLFLLFVVAGALGQASQAVLYGFATLHWRAAGIADTTIGLLWAEGVVAEVVLFAIGTRLLGRFGVSGLMMLAAAAGMVRWSAYGLTTELPVLVVMQTLHAFTFGAAHLGAMHFIARAIPSAWAATAQSLHAAISGGLGMGLASAASGLLYQRFEGGAFFFASALSTGALVAAFLLGRRWNGERIGG